jgi:hypothetical protein
LSVAAAIKSWPAYTQWPLPTWRSGSESSAHAGGGNRPPETCQRRSLGRRNRGSAGWLRVRPSARADPDIAGEPPMSAPCNQYCGGASLSRAKRGERPARIATTDANPVSGRLEPGESTHAECKRSHQQTETWRSAVDVGSNKVPAGSRIDRNHPVGPINRLIVLRQRDIIDRFAPRRHSHRYPKGGLRAIEGQNHGAS